MRKMFISLGCIMFVICAVLIYFGYDKIEHYSNSTFADYSTNAYVGGDAYNYIINSNYATGFFILATLFGIMGMGFLIIGHLHDMQETNEINRQLNQKQIELMKNQMKNAEKS
ncbi:MAG TPA: hypothetical protein VIO64_10620 [Pseudobacteroides sp.]|uniref:hypothetical protein n=1 Tax=Pseudobacteroides sp. TaxID=1968840 RepID=UPI002F93B8F3